MGVILIETKGSFGSNYKSFQAIEHGHAHAIQECIEWLASDLLKRAINSDHELHEKGEKPEQGFTK